MLERLSIENYALIQQLELELSPSLNIITGETGAGKSILLGALGLIMGNRADTAVLGRVVRPSQAMLAAMTAAERPAASPVPPIKLPNVRAPLADATARYSSTGCAAK